MKIFILITGTLLVNYLSLEIYVLLPALDFLVADMHIPVKLQNSC